MRRIIVLTVLCLFLASPALAVFKFTGEMCITDEEAQEAKKFYEQALAHEKAGRNKEAYTAALYVNTSCISGDRSEYGILTALVRKTSLKMGEEAENKGRFAEAYDYYRQFHGTAADRVQMKLATSRPGDFGTVQTGVNYFRDMHEGLTHDMLTAKDPDLDMRLQAVNGYQSKLRAIATSKGEEALIDEDKVFASRKTSITAKTNSFDELQRAEKWLELAGQEKRAHDRAVTRGDTLSANDTRTSLRLAISYYQFARNDKKIQSVQDKAKRLGDGQLQKGEKMIASEYYAIAGLGDKSSELFEAHEAEKMKAESERKDQFKNDQDSLEKELGF